MKKLIEEIKKAGFTIIGDTTKKDLKYFTVYDGTYFIGVQRDGFDIGSVSVLNKPSKIFGTGTRYIDGVCDFKMEHITNIFKYASNHFIRILLKEKPINYRSINEYIKMRGGENTNIIK